jgi:mRNA interferase HicA
MKVSEFKRWLESQGATLGKQKGSHLKVYLHGKQSILPMHKSKEIGTGLAEKIKKDLGLK